MARGFALTITEGGPWPGTGGFSAGIRITDPGLGTVEGFDALRNYLVELKGSRVLGRSWSGF